MIDAGPWTQFGPIGAVVLGLLAVVVAFLKFLGKHVDGNTQAQLAAAQALDRFASSLDEHTRAMAESTRLIQRLLDRLDDGRPAARRRST